MLIVLRDMLEVAQNRKEVKRAIYNKLILLNTKIYLRRVGKSTYQLQGGWITTPELCTKQC